MSGNRKLNWLSIGCFCLALFCSGPVPAQEEPPDDTKSLHGPPERIIYVPFKQFEDVFGKQDGSVVMPYAEYLELWALKAAADGADRKPVDAVITRAAYVATIEQDIARIKAELTVNVVGKPWVAVPLDFGEAAVGAVTGEEGDMLLRGTGEGTYALLFKQQGEQTVSLELTARVVTSPDGRQIDLDVPPVAITTFELSVPEDDQEIEVRPRLVQQPVDSGDDETRVRASLGATQHIAAAWRPRATAKPQMQLLASVTNRQRYHIADGLIHADAWLTYEVLRGELQQVRIDVPVGHRILDVTATTKIRGWQTDEQDGRQTLTIELLSAVDDKVTIEVHTEQKLDGKTVAVGGREEDGGVNGIHALDVVRESGQIVVSAGSDLTLQVTDQTGVVRIEPEEVAKEIRQAGALSYKFYSPGFTLAVAVSPVEPRVKVAHQANLVIGEDELEVFSELAYTIERAGLFELRLTLPEGLAIDDVQSEHLKEFRQEDGTLVVVLQERTQGNVSLAIEAHQELDAEAAELTLPLPEPLDVDRETGLVRLFADDSVEVTTDEEALEAARPAPAPPQQTRGSARLRAAWQFTHRPVVIPVTMARKPTRLSANVATDISVEPNRTRVTTLVDFSVEYAGLDAFRVSIPAEALDTLQVEAVATTPTSPTLKQKTAGEAVDGWVPYTLVMQRDVLGRQQFRIIYDLEPTEAVVPVVESGGRRAEGGERRAESTAPPAEGAPSPASGGRKSPDGDGSSHAETSGTSGRIESQAAEADAQADEVPAEPAGPNRKRTVIHVIRPLGIEADDDRETPPLTRTTGEVRIQKEQSLTITAEASGADVEAVDVRELRTLPKSGAFAFRYRQHPPEETIEIDITQARYDVQEVIGTVVSRALVEVVLGEGLTATYRCRYRVKSTERQRLRVELPKDLEVLSVLVDGAEVRLEPDPAASAGELWDTYFVKVARSGASDEPFSLTFQFLWTVNPPPFDSGFMQGRLELPLPRIGEPATAAVQQTRVVIWVPREYVLMGDPSGFILLEESSLMEALWGNPRQYELPIESDNQWIGDTKSSLLEFPTTGRIAFRYSNLGDDLERNATIRLLWWDRVWNTVVFSIALALIGLLLMRTSWENKLGILLMLAFAGTLIGLKSEQVLAQTLSAARFGLLFLLGLWIVGALFGRRHPAKPVAGNQTASSSGVTSTVPPHVAVVPPPGVFEQDH